MPETPEPSSPLRDWLAGHADSATSSFLRLWRKPVAALLTISAMALVLSLPLGLWLALHNLEHLPAAVERSRTIELFLTPGTDHARAQALAAQLRALDTVASVEHLTPEQGLVELQAQGLGEVETLLSGEHALPHLLRVTPKNEDAALVTQLAELPEVDLLQHDGQWQQQVDAWLRLGHRLMWGLGVLFGLGSVLVVGNTVRLDIQSRHEDMRVLQLLGAKSGFIRRPFVYLGLWYGLLSGLGALALVAGAATGLRAPLMALLSDAQHLLVLHGLTVQEMLLILTGSTLLGGGGARLVSGALLHRSETV